MTKIKLHYDGWLSLPEDLRRVAGLSTGDRVEAELVDGAIVLRPAGKGRQPTRGEAAAVEPQAIDTDESLSPAADDAPVKRRPGRPRKTVPIVEPAAASDAAQRMAGGAKREVAPSAVPDPVDRSLITIGPPKLVKKADLPPKAAPADPAPAGPHVFKLPSNGAGYGFEERRPFRHVEVRKLGPGRRHNQPRQRVLGPAV